MKITPIEKKKAQKPPALTIVLEVIGTIQFLSASFVTFSVTALLGTRLGAMGTIIGIFAGVGLGLSASVLPFVLARIIESLNAIQWNTSGSNIEHEKGDFRALAVAVNTLTENIQAIVGNARNADAPADAYDPDHDPFDDFGEE